MKRIIFRASCIIMFAFLGVISANAQVTEKDVVGTWQFDTPLVAAGYVQHYSFFQDGTFIYGTSEFDGLRRILCFGGTYKILNNCLLELTTTYTREIEGGTPERDEIVGGTGWIINGGKTVMKNLKRPAVSNLILERAKSVITEKGDSIPCMLIDKQEFYMVDENLRSLTNNKDCNYEFVEINDTTLELRVSINGLQTKDEFFCANKDDDTLLPEYMGKYKDCLIFLQGYGQQYRNLLTYQMQDGKIIKDDYEHSLCINDGAEESYLFFYIDQPMKMVYDRGNFKTDFKELNANEYANFKGKVIELCEGKFSIAE